MKCASEKSPWLSCYSPKADADFRLLCFPYAGAGASVFRPWSEAAGPALEVQGIQLPGREYRLREPLLTDVSSVVDALIPDIVNLLDKPFSIFGHSLGALIAFEFTRKLQRLSLPLPQRLFVSARQAPQIPLRGQKTHLLPESHLMEELRHYAGTPEVVLQDNGLMSILLPIIRADLAMNETYDYTPASQLPCPISAFAGLKDTKVSVSSVEAWADQTSQDFEVYYFSGNHFFIKQDYPSILNFIRQGFAQADPG
ncbi:putative thioesterase [filamentous cyanobacterium CCP3]|nr:putative thioesterase [filamentous cyanobacterium CCP3]